MAKSSLPSRAPHANQHTTLLTKTFPRFSPCQNNNNNNRGPSKQLSKHKRRQMKRAQAAGGLLGGLQKTCGEPQT